MSESAISGPLKDLLERMGNTDPRFKLIAEYMQKGNPSNMSENSSSESLNDLLDSIGNTDPRLRLIAEYMQKGNPSNMSENLQNRENRPRHNDMRTLKRERDYRILVERNNILASALGACPYCWGTEVTCECKGEGCVGSRPPDKQAFTELVLPVLSRFGIGLDAEPQELNKDENDSRRRL